MPLVLLALRFAGDITKDEQVKILKKWGKKEAESLRGGNYNRDILSVGLVHEVGKSGKATVYGLTERGKKEAENILKKL